MFGLTVRIYSLVRLVITVCLAVYNVDPFPALSPISLGARRVARSPASRSCAHTVLTGSCA